MAAQRARRRKPSASRPASWLIFADRGGVGESLRQMLEAQGEKSILVSRGKTYERIDRSALCIRPDRPEDMRRLFESATAPISRMSWNCSSVEPRCLPSRRATAASMKAAQSLGCVSALQLVQEMARAQWREPPRLWLITRGAQAAGDESLPVTWLSRRCGEWVESSLRNIPDFWGGLVDLEPESSAGDAPPISCGRKFPLPMEKIRLLSARAADGGATRSKAPIRRTRNSAAMAR